MPKVSIIIPVYNSQKYLPKCIESIIQQTEKDIEILIVDDGSTDNSLSVIKTYENKDNRVKSICKKNGGVSSARNVGIKMASGEYIMFLDSDDWINDNTAIEKLYRTSIKYNADIIRFEIFSNNMNKREGKTKIYNLKNDDSIHNMIIETYKFASCWGQMIKKSIIDKNNILFNENIKYGEDTLFNICLYSKINTIVLSEEEYYSYRKNSEGAIMTTNIDLLIKRCEDYIIVYSKLYDFANECKLNNKEAIISERILIELNNAMKEIFNRSTIKVKQIKNILKNNMLKETIQKYKKNKKRNIKISNINRILICCIVNKQIRAYAIIAKIRI